MVHYSRRRSSRGSRRGVVVVLVAVLIVVFLVTMAFSVDVAYMQMTRTDLRTATDAAARAAGEALSRTQNLQSAIDAARSLAGENKVAGADLLLADDDIIFGNSQRQANGAWTFTPDGTPINAVRVIGRRTRLSDNGSVPLFFGRALGRQDFEPVQVSTVVRLDRDICLVIDRSSSMKLYLTDTAAGMSPSDSRFCQVPHSSLSRWSALANAVATFNTALGTTPQNEFVAAVSYASEYTACEISNPQSKVDQTLTATTSLIDSAMATYSSSVFNGGTDIEAGIIAGVVELTGPNARPFAAKTMVVFTDGHATHGGDPAVVAANAALSRIVIHTVTFGNGANQEKMIEVAEATGGKHYHAPDAQRLTEIFEEIALTMPVVFTE